VLGIAAACGAACGAVVSRIERRLATASLS